MPSQCQAKHLLTELLPESKRLLTASPLERNKREALSLRIKPIIFKHERGGFE
jgi:hypothetical protein